MTTTKVPPPRKLTENEDNDSFDDFWFQVTCYYSRDEAFKQIFDDPNYVWQAPEILHRGLSDSKAAANLNTLLRALATYAAGPYIRTNILEKATSLNDVKKEFMKYLEIDLTDLTALDWFDIKRRPSERPLVFYMRLRYHMSKHLLKQGDSYRSDVMEKNETLTPSMERLIVMEWLYRLDERLVKFVKEKFATELSSGSAVLITMVETLARNVDHYIMIMNNPADIEAVSYSNPSPHTLETVVDDSPRINFQVSRGGRRNFQPRNRGTRTRSFNGRYNSQRSRSFRGNRSNQVQQHCLYCYMEFRNGGANNYRHPINDCPLLSQMYGNVNFIESEHEAVETHPYDDLIEDFVGDTDDGAYEQD